MDASGAVASVLAGFGLSAAAGLNPWLPLLLSALLHRLDVVDLGAPVDDLSSTAGLATLAVLTALDFVGDKVPGVDHLVHALGTVVAPASGAALFAGQTGVEADLPTAIAVALGALTAGGFHAGRAAVRPASTAATGGFGNPLLSLVEDAGALTLTLLAFAVPVVAALLVVLLAIFVVRAWRRFRRLRTRLSGPP